MQRKFRILIPILFGLNVVGNLVLVLFLIRSRPAIRGAEASSISVSPVTLTGSKEISRVTWPVSAGALTGRDTLSVTLDLKSVCLLPDQASSVAFTGPGGKTYSVALADYVTNCTDGSQTAHIPIADFFPDGVPESVTALTVQIWQPAQYAVGINTVTVTDRVLGLGTGRGRQQGQDRRPTQKPPKTPTLAPTNPVPTPEGTAAPTPTPLALPSVNWPLRSVSSMKESKDRVCNQRDAAFIRSFVQKAKDLGVTHIGVETPYDNPVCGDAVAYTNAWVTAIHQAGLNVWHRHMPLAFEGIYNTPKIAGADYVAMIAAYIRAHPDFFTPGDIFTPIPEPQNGGIAGVTYCPFGICIFSGPTAFNMWLRDAMYASEAAFNDIGLSGKIGIGYFGFDGFVAWGDNNPDWHGILEDETIARMGNITIDHYPEIVGDTMENDLNELIAKYPTVPIIIGEWGTITGGDVEQQVKNTMGAAIRPNVVGFNYWHMGTGGNEALINEDFTNRAQYDEVQSFFK